MKPVETREPRDHTYRPTAPAVWHDRVRQTLRPQTPPTPELFISEVQRIGELTWQAISVTGGEFKGAPPGLYIETNLTKKGVLDNPYGIRSCITSAVSHTLSSEVSDRTAIPTPQHIKNLDPSLKNSKISIGNGVKFHTFAVTNQGNVILEVLPMSLAESMNALRSLEPKPSPFNLKHLFKRNKTT